MRNYIALALGLHLISALSVQAEGLFDFGTERKTIGIGRLFDNDYFGDGKDRWHTGAYAISIMRGPERSTKLPDRIGTLLEYRLRTEMIAPAALSGADSADRAFVGALSVGLHSQFAFGPTEVSMGGDLVGVGPSTGLSDLQDWFHDAIGLPSISNPVLDNQLDDALHASATLEVGAPFRLRENVTLRPFVEAKLGVEDIARVGFDVVLGRVGHDDIAVRDVVTGQRYRSVTGDATGFGFTLGADYAAVGDSIYFPASFGTVVSDNRSRARAGMNWQISDDMSFYYGLTYLSPEYVGQSEGQVLGSLKLNFNF